LAAERLHSIVPVQYEEGKRKDRIDGGREDYQTEDENHEQVFRLERFTLV